MFEVDANQPWSHIEVLSQRVETLYSNFHALRTTTPSS